MNQKRLKELLRNAPVPEEREAEERGWRVVRAAFESRYPSPRRARGWRLVLAAAAGLVVLVLGLTPAGAKVADLFEDVTGVGRHHKTQPALTSLPAPGRLLVTSANGAWVVSQDGSMRYLGDYTNATWSPSGLFVAVTHRPRQLSAVEPGGTPHWSLAQRRSVTEPRWAPSGYRIAYLSGDSLRVVAGDGTDDRLLESPVARVAPAWKSLTPAALRANPSGVGTHVLAFADRNGRVEVVDVDSTRPLWISSPGPTPTLLEWSADHKRLLGARPGRLAALRPQWQALVDARGPDLHRPTTASFAPQGNTLALVQAQLGRGGVAQSRISIMHPGRHHNGGTLLLTLPGRVTGVTWSADGRWLLLAREDADQWLFLQPTRSPRGQHITTVSSVSRQFAPGEQGRRLPATARMVLQGLIRADRSSRRS